MLDQPQESGRRARSRPTECADATSSRTHCACRSFLLFFVSGCACPKCRRAALGRAPNFADVLAWPEARALARGLFACDSILAARARYRTARGSVFQGSSFFRDHRPVLRRSGGVVEHPNTRPQRFWCRGRRYAVELGDGEGSRGGVSPPTPSTRAAVGTEPRRRHQADSAGRSSNRERLAADTTILVARHRRPTRARALAEGCPEPSTRSTPPPPPPRGRAPRTAPMTCVRTQPRPRLDGATASTFLGLPVVSDRCADRGLRPWWPSLAGRFSGNDYRVIRKRARP